MPPIFKFSKKNTPSTSNSACSSTSHIPGDWWLSLHLPYFKGSSGFSEQFGSHANSQFSIQVRDIILEFMKLHPQVTIQQQTHSSHSALYWCKSWFLLSAKLGSFNTLNAKKMEFVWIPGVAAGVSPLWWDRVMKEMSGCVTDWGPSQRTLWKEH